MIPYTPTTISHAIITFLFYLIMAGFVVYSIFAIYALIRYGRSTLLALIVSLAYIIISISLYTTAAINLGRIKF